MQLDIKEKNMKYAHINEQNKLLGWYDEKIHSIIPTPNIKVTEEQWQKAINNCHNKVNEDGTTELFDFRVAEEIAIEAQQNINYQARQSLFNSDWKVIRELERLFLKNSELNKQREALRDSVIEK